MNQYFKKFIKDNFTQPGKALDLGAGDFEDVFYFRNIGWECDGVDKDQGVDLEEKYISKNSPYDLVFSKYVFHKINNQDVFLDTMIHNLKEGGWLLLQTFDISDKICIKGTKKEELEKKLKQKGVKEISFKIFDIYDEEHRHWHRILQASAQK